MDSSERAALAALMARMAAGDQAAVVEFIERYKAQLVGTVRRIVTDSHIDPWTMRDELEGLAIDAGFVIADAAGAWRADGALPWTWAYSAIRARVLAVFGIPVPRTSEEQIREALSGCLCRCTGYQQIFESVEEAVVRIGRGSVEGA